MTLLDFEIRVTGRVPADIVGDIPGGRAVARPVETVLRGPVSDQVALIGLVNRLQALGLELVEMRRISPSPTAAERSPGQPAPGQRSTGVPKQPKRRPGSCRQDRQALQ
jgi:hypothetical protein